MNPNFSQQGNSDTEGAADMGDPNESGEGEMNFSTQDYPELQGLQQGASIKVTCEGTVSGTDGDNVSISINPGSCQFETQGAADKAMGEMSKQDNVAPSQNAGAGEDF